MARVDRPNRREAWRQMALAVWRELVLEAQEFWRRVAALTWRIWLCLTVVCAVGTVVGVVWFSSGSAVLGVMAGAATVVGGVHVVRLLRGVGSRLVAGRGPSKEGDSGRDDGSGANSDGGNEETGQRQ